MRIALVQQHASPDRGDNLSRALDAMQRARDHGAELIVFAELAIDRFFPQHQRRDAARTIAEASVSLETSAWTYAACPPVSRIPAATAAPASSATSVSTTCAPSAANSCEATMPIPLAAPVMSATLPSSRPISPLPPTPQG